MNATNREDLIETTRNEVFELLKQSIRPEFLNRIDELIMFTPLSEKEIRDIVNLQLKLIAVQLQNSGVHLDITEKALDWVAKAGYDPQYGARPVKRVLQRHLLNELSKKLIGRTIDPGKPIVVDLENGELSFGNNG